MTLIIKGSGLTIEDVVRVARHGEKVQLDPKAIERINKCRAMLERKIEAHEIMYGVNTGIGEFSEVVLMITRYKISRNTLFTITRRALAIQCRLTGCEAPCLAVSMCMPMATADPGLR